MKDPDKSKDNSRPSALRVRVVSLVIALGVAGVLAGAFFYHYIVSGGLRARQTPSTLETAVAQKLVNLSIPNDVKTLTNPLDKRPDGAAVAAGHELYQKNCEVCHGYDGTGKT